MVIFNMYFELLLLGAVIAFEQSAFTFLESTPDFAVCLEVAAFTNMATSLEDNITITLFFTDDTALG